MKTKREKNKVLSSLLAKAKTLPSGTEISTVQLFQATFPDRQLPDFKDLFELDEALFQHSEEAGLFLDISKHWMKVEGLPFNLDFIITPLKRVVSFDVIKYRESGYPGLTEELVLDIREKTISYSACYGLGSKKDFGQYFHKCRVSEWEEIADLIAECRIDQWEIKYFKPVKDGIQWKISLIKGKRCVKKSSGSNDYPSCWEIFWSLKQHCCRLIWKEAFFVNKPEECPFCGSKAVKSYLYGLVSLGDVLGSGKYILGGCCIEKHQPKWGCTNCGAKFFEGDSRLFDLERINDHVAEEENNQRQSSCLSAPRKS